MTTESIETTVHILGKGYQIRCPQSEIELLHKSAQVLEEKMRALRDNGNIFSIDRIAIITALNLVQELLTQESKNESYLTSINQRLHHLQENVEQALGHEAQLSLEST